MKILMRGDKILAKIYDDDLTLMRSQSIFILAAFQCLILLLSIIFDKYQIIMAIIFAIEILFIWYNYRYVYILFSKDGDDDDEDSE